LYGHERKINFLDFSHDGWTLISGSNDGTLRRWDLKQKSIPSQVINTGLDSPIFAKSPDNYTLFSGSTSQPLMAWDFTTHRKRIEISTIDYKTTSVAISPDGKKLYAGLSQDAVEIWDIEKKSYIKRLEVFTSGAVEAMTHSPDGRFLFIIGAGHSWLYHGQYNFEISALSPFHGKALIVSHDSKSFFIGTRFGTIEKINLADYNESWGAPKPKLEVLATLEDHVGPFTSFAFSTDRKTLFSGSIDGSVGVWDLATLKLKRILRPDNPIAIATILPAVDGENLYLGLSDGTIRAWNLKRVRFGEPGSEEWAP
jgi:WD40 repeat protein